ncbi:DUF5615 family PIN-like protein [Runella limosa]|uniref:DUF5615 family PIN-like protein n=1 Tax=Runella limosa TaxID=370978 RepID=UPI00042464DF|nr:DUF5615 family PIN-like protein [Runella limosa]
MKIVADEGIEARLVLGLRETGFDVLYIAEEMPSLPDEGVLDLSLRENRLLLTRDKDFGDLVYRDRKKHNGIVLVRLKDTMPTLEKVKIVCDAFRQHGTGFQGAFTVIDENYIRIRN